MISFLRLRRSFTSTSFIRNAQPDIISNLKHELKISMLSKNKPRTTVIKSLLSEITYSSKASAQVEVETETILQKAIKKRMDSIQAYKDGGRDDLAAQELEEVCGTYDQIQDLYFF